MKAPTTTGASTASTWPTPCAPAISSPTSGYVQCLPAVSTCHSCLTWFCCLAGGAVNELWGSSRVRQGKRQCVRVRVDASHLAHQGRRRADGSAAAARVDDRVPGDREPRAAVRARPAQGRAAVLAVVPRGDAGYAVAAGEPRPEPSAASTGWDGRADRACALRRLLLTADVAGQLHTFGEMNALDIRRHVGLMGAARPSAPSTRARAPRCSPCRRPCGSRAPARSPVRSSRWPPAAPPA